MPDSTEKNTWTKNGIFITYIVLFSFIIPFLALFAGRGFESQLFAQKVWTYAGFGIASAIGIMMFTIMQKFNLKFGYGFIFSPEEGWMGKIKELKNTLRSPWKILFLSIILVSLFGMTGAMLNTSFVGIPTIEQQVTKTSEVIISVEPSSSSETSSELFVLFLALSFIFLIAKKYKLGKGFTILMSLFVAIPLRALFAVAIHLLRYGSEEANLIGIFITRYFNSLITLATGTIIFEYVWHSLNNFFVKINEMFANEIILIITLISLTIFTIVGSTIWYISSRKKR